MVLFKVWVNNRSDICLVALYSGVPVISWSIMILFGIIGHFWVSHLRLRATKYCVRCKSPLWAVTGCVESLREDLLMVTERFSGEFWCLVISGLWYWVHDAKTLRINEARPANKTHFCLFQVSLEVEILSPSSCTGSWSSNEVAPATTYEIRVASYLIISVAFNDYDPKLDIT